MSAIIGAAGDNKAQQTSAQTTSVLERPRAAEQDVAQTIGLVKKPTSNVKNGLDVAMQSAASPEVMAGALGRRKQRFEMRPSEDGKVFTLVPREDKSAPLKARFERRPEPLFGQTILATDASTLVRERREAATGLQLFKVAEVFTGKDEVFFGFGTPNAYLVVPDGNGGYQKFAGKSLKRDVSKIDPLKPGKEWVQSGVLVRFKGLPTDAAGKLREAMKVHHGNKYWTCVNANCRVLEDAGFTLGERVLSERYMPVSFMRAVMEEGLYYNGKRVELEIIRTTPKPMEQYALGIMKAEALTFWRHGQRAAQPRIEAIKEKSSLAKSVLEAPGKLWGKLFPKKEEAAVVPQRIAAPGLADSPFHYEDISVRVTKPSAAGVLLRMMWGSHALFEAQQSRVNIDKFLPDTLKAFPQEKPNFVTRVKKALLMSKPVVWAMRKALVAQYQPVGERSEADVINMLRTDSAAKNGKYNLVVTGDRVVVARLDVGIGKVDWLLTKHVLMSGYDPSVRFAGEIWKDAEGVVHINRNSGTYQPSPTQLAAAAEYLQGIFPHARIVADELPAAPPSAQPALTAQKA